MFEPILIHIDGHAYTNHMPVDFATDDITAWLQAFEHAVQFITPHGVSFVLHADDAAARGIADGDEVRVFNGLGEVRTAARVTTELRPGVVVLPKGLWSHNTSNGNTSNALSPDTLTDIGGGARFNDARVEVERLG